MRRTIQALGTLKEETVPTDTMAELLRAFRDWKTG